MERQSFNFFQRRAIWEAHGRRCAYCGEALRYLEVEIDHIMPQSLATDQEDWERQRSLAGLPKEFDLRGFENLLPSCRICNGRKRETCLPPGYAVIQIGAAIGKVETIRNLIEKYGQQDRADKVRLALASARLAEEITAREVEAIVRGEDVLAPDKIAFRLTGTFWEEGKPIRELVPEDAGSLMDRLQRHTEPVTVTLRGPTGSTLEVGSLRQFKEAIDHGYYALSTRAMREAFHYFEVPLALIDAMTHARVCQLSFVDEPRMGLGDIRFLPAELLFTEDLTPDERYSGRSIASLVQSGGARIWDVGAHFIEIETDDTFTSMHELLRADLDGDGTQDILIDWWGRLRQGSLTIGDVRVLTRKSEASDFEFLGSVVRKSPKPFVRRSNDGRLSAQ